MEYVYVGATCLVAGYAYGYARGYDWVDYVKAWIKKHGF